MPIVMLECKRCHAITMDQLITEEEHKAILKGKTIIRECPSSVCRGSITEHVPVRAKEETEC